MCSLKLLFMSWAASPGSGVRFLNNILVSDPPHSIKIDCCKEIKLLIFWIDLKMFNRKNDISNPLMDMPRTN